jgi:hypothetical protein
MNLKSIKDRAIFCNSKKAEEYFLTFSSPNSFTLKINNSTKNWDGTLYYSTNKSTWIAWDGTTTLSSINNNLYLRGTGNSKITGSDTGSQRFVFTGSNISCYGNAETLLDWETVKAGLHPTMGYACFAYLFYQCGSLIRSPSFNSIIIPTKGYQGMFQGTSITNVILLPALTLGIECYIYLYFGVNVKISETQTGIYQYAWRIPTAGTGIAAANWNMNMLSKTGGTFTGSPAINTTYYLENKPI